MKNLILLAFIAMPLSLSAQKNEVGVLLGSSYTTSKPANINVVSSGVAGFSYSREIYLSEDVYFNPGISFFSNRYIMDGYFTNTGDTLTFRQTPANYKQSQMTFTGLRMPLLFTHKFMQSPKGGWARLSTGTYIDYTFSTIQQYKTGDDVRKATTTPDNQFNAGLNEEFAVAMRVDKQNRHLVLSCGLLYQLTNYLDDETAFKPLQVYCKLGITF